MSSATTTPSTIDDPINAAILAVSEDRVQGFVRRPLHAIAEASGQRVEVVIAVSYTHLTLPTKA